MMRPSLLLLLIGVDPFLSIHLNPDRGGATFGRVGDKPRGLDWAKKENGQTSSGNALNTNKNRRTRQTLDHPSTTWTTAYSREYEHSMARNNWIATIPKLTKEWRVSFEVNPADYNFDSFSSVLHMTIGDKGGRVGDRTPAIWFHRTRGVIVSSAMDGKASFIKAFEPAPPPGERTKLVVSQYLERNQYFFSIEIGNSTVFKKTNSKPAELDYVKVYSGNPWFRAQSGSIRNLKIEISAPASYELKGRA